jgi:AcrR family transcriptional regulator
MLQNERKEYTMPPKQRFTREEIISAALQIARTEGLEAITARRLGSELGCSARPIFTAFESMEEVQQETIAAARTIYNGYVEKSLTEEKPFRAVGMAYVQFAAKEPKLFQLLFMKQKDKTQDLSNILDVLDDNSSRILETVEKEYQLEHVEAIRLYQCLWIFTHGIATLYATGVCSFTGNEVQLMTKDIIIGLLMNFKQAREEKHD